VVISLISKRYVNVLNMVRNARGLAVYVRDDISKRVTEISSNMKEILWMGSGRKLAHI
jgi:hypothetical protein